MAVGRASAVPNGEMIKYTETDTRESRRQSSHRRRRLRPRTRVAPSKWHPGFPEMLARHPSMRRRPRRDAARGCLAARRGSISQRGALPPGVRGPRVIRRRDATNRDRNRANPQPQAAVRSGAPIAAQPWARGQHPQPRSRPHEQNEHDHADPASPRARPRTPSSRSARRTARTISVPRRPARPQALGAGGMAPTKPAAVPAHRSPRPPAGALQWGGRSGRCTKRTKHASPSTRRSGS